MILFKCIYYKLAVDESTDVTPTAQMYTSASDIMKHFKIRHYATPMEFHLSTTKPQFQVFINESKSKSSDNVYYSKAQELTKSKLLQQLYYSSRSKFSLLRKNTPPITMQ
jgi:hypothetical protein